jgi:hypothetical protein
MDNFRRSFCYFDISLFRRSRTTDAGFGRETVAAIEAYTQSGDHAQVLAGAVRTFEVLLDWLSPLPDGDPHLI